MIQIEQCAGRPGQSCCCREYIRIIYTLWPLFRAAFCIQNNIKGLFILPCLSFVLSEAVEAVCEQTRARVCIWLRKLVRRSVTFCLCGSCHALFFWRRTCCASVSPSPMMARMARSTCRFQKEPFCRAMPYPVVAKMYLNATHRNVNFYLLPILLTRCLTSGLSVASLYPFFGFLGQIWTAAIIHGCNFLTYFSKI